MPRVSGDLLDTGDTLHLTSDVAPGAVRTVTVASVQHGLIWVSGFEGRDAQGGRITIECRRHEDAVYRAEAKIEFVPPESWALRRVGEWRRSQRREHVRVPIWGGIDVELTHDADETGIASFPLVDLSIGGARVATTGVAADELARGTRVRCRFTLDDAGDFELRAEVVRSEAPPTPGESGCAALHFLALDSEVEAELARWLQHEQMRRGR
jgi:hypothetical protein